MKRILYGLVFLASVGLAWAGPIDDSIDEILADYYKIQSALADDTTSGVDAAARSIDQTAGSINAGDSELRSLVGEIRAAAQKIQGQDLETARTTFFDLSRPLLIYLNESHSDKEAAYRFYCPMAKKGWVQSGKETRNPYYGSSMLTCGQIIE